jgi:hypothetical protein
MPTNRELTWGDTAHCLETVQIVAAILTAGILANPDRERRLLANKTPANERYRMAVNAGSTLAELLLSQL